MTSLQRQPHRKVPQVGDIFALDGARPNYSSESFYLESTDKKGHGTVMRTRVPPEIVGMLNELIASGSPYRTQQDFVRDALVHRFHQVQSLTDSVEYRETAELLMSRVTIENGLEKVKIKKSVVEDCRKMVNSASSKSDREEARRCLVKTARGLDTETQTQIKEMIDRL